MLVDENSRKGSFTGMCLRFIQHCLTQQCIDPSLISGALGLEPSQHVRIDADRGRPFHRSVKGIAHGSVKKLRGERRDIRDIDVLIRCFAARARRAGLEGFILLAAHIGVAHT